MILTAMSVIASFVLGYFLCISGRKIHRPLLGVGCLATCVFFIDNSLLILPKGSIIFDRIKEDFTDTDTRKFITSVGNIRSAQIFKMYPNAASAQQYYSDSFFPGKVLVSGDKNTVLVTLRPGSVVTEPYRDFTLIRSIPQFSLSREPRDGTGHFLRSFFTGYKTSDPEKKERFLRDAASVQSPWRSFAHRAVPLFFLSVEKLKKNDFDNAEALLVQAAEYLRPNDNADLRGAILNNLGIVRFYKGEDAKAIFKRAQETTFEKNIFDGEYTPAKNAKNNLKVLQKKNREN